MDDSLTLARSLVGPARRVLAVAALSALAACGSPSGPEDASAGLDAGRAETCPVPGAIEELPCGECGTVERFCAADGLWVYGTCEDDGCAAEECDTPGALETVRCGMCGSRERFCTVERLWEYGACEGEHGCMPGTTEEASCGFCGTTTRRCTAECVWEEDVCLGEGECAAGTTTFTSEGCPAGQTRAVPCDAACRLGAPGACAGPIDCVPACATGETCGDDGVCRCGGAAACDRASEQCLGGTCQPASCGAGAECTAGATRSTSCGLCGERTDVCSAACLWQTGACQGEGECTPGTVQSTALGCPAGQVQVLECSASCAYAVRSPCATPSPVTFDFPTAADGSSFSLSAWHDGTYIAGTRDTSLPSATSMDISVTPTNTLLASGCGLSVLVLLNGVQVGTFNVPWESMATITRSYTFPAIAGPTYTVRYESTNGRAGCGAVYFEPTTPPGTVTLRP